MGRRNSSLRQFNSASRGIRATSTNNFHVADLWLDEAAIECRRRATAPAAYPTHPPPLDARAGGRDRVRRVRSRELTATLFGGMDDSLYADFKPGIGGKMAAAENTLRTWWPDHDGMDGKITSRGTSRRRTRIRQQRDPDPDSKSRWFWRDSAPATPSVSAHRTGQTSNHRLRSVSGASRAAGRARTSFESRWQVAGASSARARRHASTCFPLATTIAAGAMVSHRTT